MVKKPTAQSLSGTGLKRFNRLYFQRLSSKMYKIVHLYFRERHELLSTGWQSRQSAASNLK
jgi:hypothetical protein